jgi:predicted lipid-binding transport protein (Tim44 family)
LKKLIAAIFSVVLIFSPVGNVIFTDDATTVEAKRYKSGKQGFSTDNNRSNNTTNFQKKEDTNQSTVNKSTANKSTANQGKTGGFFGGGLMKGLMLGGLAGLLFGSLFANMGALGSILGLLVNILGIVIVIAIIRKIFTYFKDKKKKEEPNPWKS